MDARTGRRCVCRIAVLAVAAVLVASCATSQPSHSAFKELTTRTNPSTTIEESTTTTEPVTTTTADSCAVTTGTLDQSCGADTPSGRALAARDSCAVASLANLFGKAPPPPAPCPDLSGAPAPPTTVPPCTGDVTTTIGDLATDGGNGATYTFTANGMVYNERSDTINNVVVSYTYGFESWTQVGVSSLGPIPAGGSATFSGTATFSPIYVRPVQGSATVDSVTYSDASSGSGCGNGSGA
jgi:hypothetical protein